MQDTVDPHKCLAPAESTGLAQMSYTDVFQRRVYGFNKQDAWLNRDVSELVIWSEGLRHQPSVPSRNKGETHLHLTKACVEHNAELRKTNVAPCRGKHNATLLYNPNQDLRMAMYGDLECLLDNDGFKHIDLPEKHGTTRENTWILRLKRE